MWFNLNSNTPDNTRRHFLLGFLSLPTIAIAKQDPTVGLQRWGSGVYRWFGLPIYEATLWAAENPLSPPLALKLTYRRRLKGEDIARASVDEMRRLAEVDPETLERWGQAMRDIFPDVREGDALLGVYTPDSAVFYYNSQFAGRVNDPAFARAFFGIWLDERTRAPDLLDALLKRSALPERRRVVV